MPDKEPEFSADDRVREDNDRLRRRNFALEGKVIPPPFKRPLRVCDHLTGIQVKDADGKAVELETVVQFINGTERIKR